jgi:hypothetical protein
MKLVLFSFKNLLGVAKYRYAIHLLEIPLLAQMGVDAMGDFGDQPRGGLFAWCRCGDKFEPTCGLLLIAAVQSDELTPSQLLPTFLQECTPNLGDSCVNRRQKTADLHRHQQPYLNSKAVNQSGPSILTKDTD